MTQRHHGAAGKQRFCIGSICKQLNRIRDKHEYVLSNASSPEQEDAVKDALDDVRRVLQGLEAVDVLGRDAVERRQRRIQRRLSQRQVPFRVVLHRGDLLRKDRCTLLIPLHTRSESKPVA